MKLSSVILIALFCQVLAILPTGEKVEVVEAISSTDELNQRNINTDRGDLVDGVESISEQLESIDGLPVYNSIGHQTHGKPLYSQEHKQSSSSSYDGPPPPLPLKQQATDRYGIVGDIWTAPAPDMPKIISLDVKCERQLMRVYISFNRPFFGIVFSKGHYNNVNCVHIQAGKGRTSAQFDIGVHECGTVGNTVNGMYGYGTESGSGSFFENIIVIQYDQQVQEMWDQARKLRCTWHDQYEKQVTFRPFPVDMLEVIRADFAGDNVGCWMQIQIGKGPWASEVSGLVKIGQTMTMVLAIKDDDSKFDMLVRDCFAHDGKRTPIKLVNNQGCVTRSKLMSRFTKIKNFGASASVLSYAHFQAFKFPDSMEVHFQCTIQICRYHCPDQCSDVDPNSSLIDIGHNSYDLPPPPSAYINTGRPRDERRIRRAVRTSSNSEKEVGLNRVIRVVSTGDLTFTLEEDGNATNAPTIVFPAREELSNSGLICMTTSNFAASLVVLLAILIISCLLSAFLFVRLRPFSARKSSNQLFSSNVTNKKTKCFFYS